MRPLHKTKDNLYDSNQKPVLRSVFSVANTLQVSHKILKNTTDNIRECEDKLKNISDLLSSKNMLSEQFISRQIYQLLNVVSATKPIKDITLLQNISDITDNFYSFLDINVTEKQISPLVFLKPINKIRQDLDLKPILDFDLFHPLLPAKYVPPKTDQLQYCAKKQRMKFVRALISFYQDEKNEQAQAELSAVFTKCAKKSTSLKAQDFWQVSQASLLSDNIEFKNKNKLLAKIEKLISRLAHSSESKFNDIIADKLYRLFLYKIAIAENKNELQQYLYDKHDLELFLPDNDVLQQNEQDLRSLSFLNGDKKNKTEIDDVCNNTQNILQAYINKDNNNPLNLKHLKNNLKEVSRYVATTSGNDDFLDDLADMEYDLEQLANKNDDNDNNDEIVTKSWQEILNKFNVFIDSFFAKKETFVAEDIASIRENLLEAQESIRVTPVDGLQDYPTNPVFSADNDSDVNFSETKSEDNLDQYIHITLEQLQNISKITTNFKKNKYLEVAEIDNIYDSFDKIYNGAMVINEKKIIKYSKAMKELFYSIKTGKNQTDNKILDFLQESLAILPLFLAQLGSEQPPLLSNIDDSILQIHKTTKS